MGGPRPLRVLPGPATLLGHLSIFWFDPVRGEFLTAGGKLIRHTAQPPPPSNIQIAPPSDGRIVPALSPSQSVSVVNYPSNPIDTITMGGKHEPRAEQANASSRVPRKPRAPEPLASPPPGQPASGGDVNPHISALHSTIPRDMDFRERMDDTHDGEGHERRPPLFDFDEHGRPTSGTPAQLAQPIKTTAEKWQLLPAFIKVKGIARQHIDSFNYLVNTEIRNIVRANEKIVSTIDPRWYVLFTDVRVGKPSKTDDLVVSAVTPHECRLRDTSYAATISVDIRYTRGDELVVTKNLPIGQLPMMLRSANCILTGKSDAELAKLGECPLDPGGYFIVRGAEKVILIQEQLSKNRIIIEKDSRGIIANVQSSTHVRKSRTSVLMKNGKIYLNHNTFETDINIAIILKAMGVETDQEIVQIIGTEPEYVDGIAATLHECAQEQVNTAIQALMFVGSKAKPIRIPPGIRGRSAITKKPTMSKKPTDGHPKQAIIDRGRELLVDVVLAHVPVKHFDFWEKAVFIAQIVRRILLAVKDPSTVDDKDYYGNKRLELSGQLMSLLFEDLFKKLINDIRLSVDKDITKFHQKAARSMKTKSLAQGTEISKNMPRAHVDVTRYFRADTITNGLEFALSTGNWHVKRFKMERAGVTEVLSRLSFISAVGMMTRITSQFEKTRKVSGPRALQPSQWGMLCPSDTPEGEACGLVKNLALMTHVTTDDDPSMLQRLLLDLGVQPTAVLSGEEINQNDIVFLNGLILGIHSQPRKLTRRLRQLRRTGMIGEFVSVFEQPDHKWVHIACDGGRVTRPLIIVDAKTGLPNVKDEHVTKVMKGLMKWRDLLDLGLIEYLDVSEENNTLIATYESDILPGKTTHLEIAPWSILGVCAGLIPYPHHNQSPRNTYQCAMGKQAIGAIAYNQHTRADTLLYLLSYPQRPLVQTHTVEMVGFERLPGGQNASLMVMSYSGYDIEDAVILNQASIDRGFGRCIVIRKNAAYCRKHADGRSDRIIRPPIEGIEQLKGKDRVIAERRNERYRALGMDGIAMPGEQIKQGMVLINKEVPGSSLSGGVGIPTGVDGQPLVQSYSPQPVTYKAPTDAVVDKVLVTSNDYDHVLTKVMIRQTRRPELGDKFSSRHGQKGVCGLIVSQEDMPFSDRGIVPDLIMNPHGFPSRMTVGKMIEFIAGKAGVFEGRFRHGTAFVGDKLTDCARSLVSAGYNYNGKDFVYSGTSGEALRGYVFCGPIFYQKLKHMVKDKMHARARGPRALLTRQPTEGRSRDGGLRLGEMERDCLIGYGASMLLMERLMTSSDEYEAFACTTCGLLGYKEWCQNCETGLNVRSLKIPYACKLLFQELQAMNVVPRLKLEAG